METQDHFVNVVSVRGPLLKIVPLAHCEKLIMLPSYATPLLCYPVNYYIKLQYISILLFISCYHLVAF